MGNPEDKDAATSKAYDTTKFIDGIKAKIPENADATEFLLGELGKAEERRRDTQGSFTTNRQELKQREEEISFLKEQLAPATLDITQEQQSQLDDLKFEDPEAWRNKMNQLERAAKDEHSKRISEGLTNAGTKSAEQFELEERQKILSSFVASNPDFDITKSEVAEQIPPVYINQLKAGTISYSDFLAAAKKFVTADKKTSTEVPPVSGTDVNNIRGGPEPTKGTETKTIAEEYNNLTF